MSWWSREVIKAAVVVAAGNLGYPQLLPEQKHVITSFMEAQNEFGVDGARMTLHNQLCNYVTDYVTCAYVLLSFTSKSSCIYICTCTY